MKAKIWSHESTGFRSPARLSWAGRFDSCRRVENHSHPGTEIVLVTEGTCTIEVKNESYTGEANSIFVLPANVPHNKTFGYARTTYLGFAPVPELLTEHPRVLHLDPADTILRWLEDLCDLFRGGEVPESINTLLAAVLQRLTELEGRNQEKRRLHPTLEKALGLVERCEGALLSLEVLAAKSGVSASHLCALFQQQFGRSPMKYQKQLRMQQASRLLANPYARVQEVAEQCGYEDVSYFIRVFKKEYGLPPRQWRQAR